MTIQPNTRIQGVQYPGADSLVLRLPAGCGQVIAVWYDTGTFDTVGGYVNRPFSLSAYVIECHASPDDALPDTGWETLLTVTDNRLSTRQHLLDLGGCRWVRIRFLRFAGVPELRFDIHDAVNGISDSWLFLGDSITACAMVNAWGTSFAEHIHALDPRFYPVQQNGGIGSISEQLLDTRADVTFGGGSKYFNQTAQAGEYQGMTLKDQAKARGYQYVEDPAQLGSLSEADQSSPVLGLFAAGNLPTQYNESKTYDGETAQEIALKDQQENTVGEDAHQCGPEGCRI